MMSVKIFSILFVAFVCLEVCRGAAVRDIARNVRSELVNLDAGLNPQSKRSKGLDLDVPAGKFLFLSSPSACRTRGASKNQDCVINVLIYLAGRAELQRTKICCK